MKKTAIITSAIQLTKQEVDTLTKVLGLSTTDSVTFTVDPSVIAGLRVSIDGKTVDLTVKRQLAELAK